MAAAWVGDSRLVAKVPPEQLPLPFSKLLESKLDALGDPKVVDFDAARRRLRPPPIDGRQAIVMTLVEQLAGLVRGTTTPAKAGAVRKAASKALDIMDRVEAGQADLDDARKAFREVEALLQKPR